MKQEQIIICSSSDLKDDQMRVIVYPEDSHYSFDCIRLQLTSLKKDGDITKKDELKIVDMTPDEALEIASMLNNAVRCFLLTNKEYDKFIKKEKKPHNKKCGFEEESADEILKNEINEDEYLEKRPI